MAFGKDETADVEVYNLDQPQLELIDLDDNSEGEWEAEEGYNLDRPQLEPIDLDDDSENAWDAEGVCNLDQPQLEPIDLDDDDEYDVISDNLSSSRESMDWEDLIARFADERIAFAMKQYTDEGNDIGLFAAMFLCNKFPVIDFFPNMLKALYRYHNSNPNEETQGYYRLMLEQGASYLSSVESLAALKTLIQDGTEIDPFDFLDLILTENDFEQRKISPFTINELDDLAQKFIDRAKQDPYFSESEERKEKLDDYVIKLLIMTL